MTLNPTMGAQISVGPGINDLERKGSGCDSRFKSLGSNHVRVKKVFGVDHKKTFVW